MSLSIQNKSRSIPLIISISSLFSRTKLATLTLKVQETSTIPSKNLRVNHEGANPGAVMIAVYTPQKTLVWKGPVPISTTSSPITIDPKTKSVSYGDTRLPSMRGSDKFVPMSSIHICSVFVIVVILLIWILVSRFNNKDR